MEGVSVGVMVAVGLAVATGLLWFLWGMCNAPLECPQCGHVIAARKPCPHCGYTQHLSAAP